MLLDVRPWGHTGKAAEALLEEVGITTNKNTIPGETASPFVTSGIRIGAPALTTRGMGEAEMKQLGQCIANTLKYHTDAAAIAKVREHTAELAAAFPLFSQQTNLITEGC